jgi:tetratricopeptide (TPR) repeat protein
LNAFALNAFAEAGLTDPIAYDHRYAETKLTEVIMKVVNRLLHCFALVAALTIPVLAQDGGVIHGTISDFLGEPIEGAAARIEGEGVLQEFPTNAEGMYSADLPPGTYTLTFMVQRQPLLVETGLVLGAGADIERDYDLSALSESDQAAVRDRLDARASNDAVRAAFDAGRAAMAAGNIQEAISQFQLAAENDDQHIILANLALAQSQAGMHTEAAQNYRLALVQEPGNGAYLQNLGIALGNSGDVDGAADAISQAAALDPTVAGPAYYNLGLILLNRGQMDGAVDAFRNSIAADDGMAPAYFQLGLALVGTAPGDAVEPLERFLEIADDGDTNVATAEQLLEFARTQ